MQTANEDTEQLAIIDEGSGTVILRGLPKVFGKLGVSPALAARVSGMPPRTVQKIFDAESVRRASIEKLFNAMRDAGYEIDAKGKIVPISLALEQRVSDSETKVTPLNGDYVDRPFAKEIATVVQQLEAAADNLKLLTRKISKDSSAQMNAPTHLLEESMEEVAFYFSRLRKAKSDNPGQE